MRAISFVSIWMVLSSGWAGAAVAAPREFDLAGSSQVTRTVPAGKTTIVFTNAVNARYGIEVVIRTTSIPSFAEISIPVLPSGGRGTRCDSVKSALYDLVRDAETEAEVRRVRDTAWNALKSVGCRDRDVEETLNDLKAATSFVEEISLGLGEEAEIHVSRTHAGTDTSWALTLRTRPRGQWLTTYGFSMIPDRDEKFWLRPTATAGDFEVVREASRKDELKFIPALFFTWLSEPSARSNYVIGPTAGLGVGKDTYSLFLGGSVLYNWNVHVAAGASAFQISRLSGKYHEGDVVHENLDDEQLHRRPFWPAWYVALTFRFGDNPFESNAAAKQEQTP